MTTNDANSIATIIVAVTALVAALVPVIRVLRAPSDKLLAKGELPWPEQ